MSTADLYGLVGQVLDGQFRVDQVIGEGGFSVVYRGLHVGLDEPVAIKCLKLPTQLASPVVEAFVQRFRNESKIHYRLSRGSLHIARTIAAGTTMAPAIGALVPYMVLEWLDGYTLAEELRARRERGEQGRRLKDVIRLLDPVADAMAYAHAQGVVHRDLNPSNIFVAHAHDSSKLKVLDFGVAKIVSDHALSIGPRAATIGQIRMFTPAYAAPEQFQEDLGPIGPQTDVYSFAVMVVELLVDRSPIEGEHLGDYADRALDPVRRPTPRAMDIDVGDAVEAVIARAVSVNPKERPHDVGEFWGMLKHAAQRDQKVRDSDVHGFPNPPVQAAPSAREPRRAHGNAGRAPVAESAAAATWVASSMPADVKVVIASPPQDKAKPNEGGETATVAHAIIDVTDAPAAAPPNEARPRNVIDMGSPHVAQTISNDARPRAAMDANDPRPRATVDGNEARTRQQIYEEARARQAQDGNDARPRQAQDGNDARPRQVIDAGQSRARGVVDPGPRRQWPSRPSGGPIPDGERPRWHSPSMPKAPELVRPSVVPPRKSNFPMFIMIAIGLTVTFVVLAIVATEMAR
ncbi:MAG TPA: serine/threonine-protein kinase [Polyangiaceae bacterium]